MLGRLMKKTLIFSDVHLKVSREDRPRHAEFVAFLRAIDSAEYDRVICLGDLFDFWFEYRHVIFSGYFEVLRAFAELRDAGIKLHLVCGNHDFWAGRFLRETLGFEIHQGHAVLPFGEQRVYFVHGDGMNPRDWGYRVYKRFARNRWVIAAFRLLHPDWAMRLAQGVSHSSRTLLQERDPAHGPEARALQAFAEEVLRRGEAEVVMCGHAHAPARIDLPLGEARGRTEGTGEVQGERGKDAPATEGLYINTGDWMGHRSYVVWDGDEFALLNWSGDKLP
ncbi:MAG: UDP-2,3-diacylglucosamine diphosphatase [Candidatus Hydrogenedentes bacterium]|nr:UDP-2,3-diacylglucosamine diphosphatase [Candidatus Hydrogenedentota bacterium]